MVKRLILVAGNIGSGKTSLTERLGERLGWCTAYESVADNPYLPDFYADMRSLVLPPADFLPRAPGPAAPGNEPGPALSHHRSQHL